MSLALAIVLGTFKLSATRCTIDGPPLAMTDAVKEVLAAAPDGSLVVLDGKGVLHRYRPRAGTTCKLASAVVVAALHPADDDFPSAFVDVDGHGTIYARLGGKVFRVDGKKVAPICTGGDTFSVSASPRADRVWSYGALTSVFHEDAACAARGTQMNLSPTMDDFIGTLYAIDDRVVLDAGMKQYLIDGTGKRTATLADPLQTVVGFAACGEYVCGLGMNELGVWRSTGERLGVVDLDALAPSHEHQELAGFAMSGGAAYVLAVEGGKVAIIRIDGLPH